MDALSGDGDVTVPSYDSATIPPASVCACDGLSNTTAGQSGTSAASADDAGDAAFLRFRRKLK